MKTHVTAAIVAGCLGGTLTVAGRGPAVASADDGLRGPVAAIERATRAAGQASERAQATDRQADSALGRGDAAAAGIATSERVGGTNGGDERRDAGEGGAGGTHVVAGGVAGAPDAEAPARYDPGRHRDPFRPPTIASSTVSVSPRTPLERYEIGQLRLVGVVWDGATARAMVEDSAGLGYIVTAGTPIGSNGGVVRRVEPRRVLIEESAINFYGDKEPREVVMELPQEDRAP